MSARKVDTWWARDAFLSLLARLEDDGFTGWDPYDALASPWLGRTARTSLSRRAAIQFGVRSPVNARALLGVPRLPHVKGLALCLSALLRTSETVVPNRNGTIERLVSLLADARVPCEAGHGWGYGFDVETRWGFYPRSKPNAVVTAFVVEALLDLADALPSSRRDDLTQGAISYAIGDLLTESCEGPYFSYYPGATAHIINANLLVAAFVARGAHDSAQRDLARSAMALGIHRQSIDGSWTYGDGPGLTWIDGFHSCFNLRSLAAWLRVDPDDEEVESCVRRGLAYYLRELLDADGAARASNRSRYPVDIHACASGILMLSELNCYSPDAAPALARLTDWTRNNLSRPDGFWAFRLYRNYRNNISYFRWGNAHMLLALASLAAVDDA
jgi:hypothetical protein